jgi:flagella basal body P-ring formation protein FlgA
MKTALRNLMVAAVMAGIASPLLAGTIRMQPRAVVAEGAVHLGDVAQLSNMGSDAEKLSEVVILETLPKDGAKVRTEQVLFAIAAARGVKATADLQISGSAECLVVRQGEEAKFAALAVPEKSGASKKTGESNRAVSVETVSHTPAPAHAPAQQASVKSAAKKTLSELLVEQHVMTLGARREDVRVDFETISPWLDTPVAANQRWQFKSSSRGLGTVVWEAQLIEGTKVVQKINLVGKVTQRQTVVAVMKGVNRGGIIQASDVREDEVWMDRKGPSTVASAADVIGAEATRALVVGTMIDSRDVKIPEMVARGEMLTVYAVSGSLVIKGSVRATESGKMHDSIQVKNEQTGEIYPVTLIGKKIAAVGTYDAQMEKKLKEMP